MNQNKPLYLSDLFCLFWSRRLACATSGGGRLFICLNCWSIHFHYWTLQQIHNSTRRTFQTLHQVHYYKLFTEIEIWLIYTTRIRMKDVWEQENIHIKIKAINISLRNKFIFIILNCNLRGIQRVVQQLQILKYCTTQFNFVIITNKH